MIIDGEWAKQPDTSDFMASAMLSLRHIIANTGAQVVLSSEWRRDEDMRMAVDTHLKEYEMPPAVDWTTTSLERDMSGDDPLRAFIERRAREISDYVKRNPYVQQWVVVDDMDISVADEDRKAGTLRMSERFVRTHNKIGLTLEDAGKA